MNKKIATRIILYNPIDQTVIAAHPTGRKFKSKDGSIAKGVFNLIGGEIDEGESQEDCIIRETKEESGLELEKSKLKNLGFYNYTEYKDLWFFYYEIDTDLKKLKCESFFESESGKMLPEINGFSKFSLITELDMFFPVLQKCLKQIIAKYPELFK